MGSARDGSGLDWVSRRVRSFLQPKSTSPDIPNYAELAAECSDVIDFALPASVSVVVARHVSSQLDRGVSLELPSKRVALCALHESPRSLMLGRVWLDSGSLEALYLGRARGSWLLCAMASVEKSSILLGTSTLFLTAAKKTPSASTAWSFNTAGAVLGCQHLHRISGRAFLGAEIYYAGGEKSGGVSLGARWVVPTPPKPLKEQGSLQMSAPPLSQEAEDVLLQCPAQPAVSTSQPPVLPMVATAAVNPIMGNVQMTLVSPVVRHDISFAARYDLNVHSFDADLVSGLAFVPAAGQFLQLRCSWRHGLALCLGSALEGAARFRIGVSSGPMWSKPTGIESVPRPLFAWRSLAPSIGFEIAVES